MKENNKNYQKENPVKKSGGKNKENPMEPRTKKVNKKENYKGENPYVGK